MSLKLYNTLTRTKELFSPIDPKNVRLYVCGPTVYDDAHIGNARPLIVFDLLFRLLRGLYGEAHVKYVRNITDVDDKINARATQLYPQLSPEAAIFKLTEETTKQFHKDAAALGVLEPTVEPRATQHIFEMVDLCEVLIQKGHAYVAADHVLFDVSTLQGYGKLSNRSLKEMEAGARVEVAPYKKNPMDFVLWKPSKSGEPSWVSPAGIKVAGRPGWHLECSAMSFKHLGQVFDIHGGGIDLIFPHHENEIAQSCCAFDTSVMAKVWMHNGFLQVEGEKMSKSLGNFITIHELLETEKFGGHAWSGHVLRLNMLKTHYRQPIDWTTSGLEDSRKTLLGFKKYYLPPKNKIQKEDPLEDVDQGILNALEDDLNTPQALTRLFEIKSEIIKNEGVDGRADQRLRESFSKSLRLLGFQDLENLEEKIKTYIDTTRIESLIASRLEARKRKDFKESDRIRDELALMGVTLKDSKDPKTGELLTHWELL